MAPVDLPRDRAGAALGLSVLLFFTALPEPGREAPLCEHPSEHAAQLGATTVVSCDTAKGAPLRGPARLLFGQRIDLNRASARSLEVLPGIGPRRAEAIVRARGERPFARVGELRRVPGIGPKTLARLEALVQVEPQGRPADR